jgi:hypothetical protein
MRDAIRGPEAATRFELDAPFGYRVASMGAG